MIICSIRCCIGCLSANWLEAMYSGAIVRYIMPLLRTTEPAQPTHSLFQFVVDTVATSNVSPMMNWDIQMISFRLMKRLFIDHWAMRLALDQMFFFFKFMLDIIDFWISNPPEQISRYLVAIDNSSQQQFASYNNDVRCFSWIQSCSICIIYALD